MQLGAIALDLSQFASEPVAMALVGTAPVATALVGAAAVGEAAAGAFEIALLWTRRATALGAVVNAVELLAVARLIHGERTWRDRTLVSEWGPVRSILSARMLPVLALVQLCAAAGLGLLPVSSTRSIPALGLSCAIVLCLTTLLSAARFRGTMNGGSDGMLFTVLGGLVVAQLDHAHLLVREAGLLYIAAQLTLSYLRAGVVKVRRRDWWTGEAMARFIELPAYGVPLWVPRHLPLLRVVGIGVMVFECLAPLAWLHPDAAMSYLLLALVFHVGTAVLFGLNRFLLAWTAAMPALWYAVQRA